MNTLLDDLRYALRRLRKNLSFTLVVVLTLGLGIGANTAVFSWIQAILLHPLPGVAQAGQLLTLETIAPSGQYIDTSYPDYRDYRDQAKLLTGLIVFQDRPLSLGDDQQAERVWAELVSGNFFDVLGVKPAVGRFFLPAEQAEKPGAYPVAVISSELWRRRFNSDPGIIGKTVKLNRQPFTIIGVTPEKFKGTIVGLSYDLYVPLFMQEQLAQRGDWLNVRDSRPLHTLARLKPGANLTEARAEIQLLARQLAQAYPQTNQGISATLLPIWRAPYGAQSLLSVLLQILMGIGGVVLLIVCANVANLLLARSTARQKEISIRLALGASRRRVIRQLLTESLLLGLLGAAVGLMLAFWITDFLRFFIPNTELPVTLTTGVNLQSLGFTLLLSLLTGVIFGLAPALQVTRPDLYHSLKEGGRSATAGPRARRLRGLLVVSEVALALVALIGAGLFVKSFQQARKSNVGFDPEGVLLVGFDLSSNGYNQDQGKNFCRQLRERVERLPGVQAVSYAEDVPLGFDGGAWTKIGIEGYVPRSNENMRIYRNLVAPGYFNLMRIPLLAGREFTERDDEKAPLAAIINETFARRFFPGQEAIGRKIHAGTRVLNIVGLVKDSKYRSLSESAEPYFYIPFLQFYRPHIGFALHIRADGRPEAMLGAVRREVQAIDPAVPVFAAIPLADYIGASFFTQKVAATLLSILGLLALLLAALGLYSVMAYSVTQQTREIGIRLALGAQARDVFKLVIGQGLRLVLSGIVIGLATAFAFTRLASGLLFGVSATDPATFALIALLLTGVALLACLLPARRATKVNPLIALRYE
jgi:putative ABC transport system permease protein